MREIAKIHIEVNNPGDQPVDVRIRVGDYEQKISVPPHQNMTGKLPLVAEYGCLLPLLVVILSGIVGALV